MTDGMLFDREFTRAAVISDCGTYRYTLNRMVGHYYSGSVNWIMLNPSRADAVDDDPTVLRCIRYTKDWGYGNLIITNLFALRSTDTGALKLHAEPIGPENDRHLIEQARRATIVVCAWGAEPMAERRSPVVLGMLRATGIVPHVLGFTKSGQPLHPLFKPARLVPIPWEMPKP